MNEYWQTFFDTDRERIGTGSSKWDNLGKLFDNPDAIPMWVADMDFPTAPAVTEALVKRAQHGLFGYNVAPATAKQAVCDWMQRRHGAHIEPDWIFSSPGVVDSIFHTLCALTGPDDPVLIQQPVYGPFRAMTVKSERPLVKSSLIETEDGFEMDFDDLEQKFASGVKAMILCNPHNPVGRIWTRDELTRLLALCNRYGVLLLDDETKEMAKEIVRCDALERVYMALDYFDASINRISAWVVGVRSWQKALLSALCTPNAMLKELQDTAQFTKLMVLQEELKLLPLGDVWAEYCRQCGVPATAEWFKEIERYEADVLSKR